MWNILSGPFHYYIMHILYYLKKINKGWRVHLSIALQRSKEEHGERGCYKVLKSGIQSQNKTKLAARPYGILGETLGSVFKGVSDFVIKVENS